MTNPLDKLGKIIAARTPGPWEYDLDEGFPRPVYDVSVKGCAEIIAEHCGKDNAAFTAAMGTHADLIWDVVRAADTYASRLGSCAHAWGDKGCLACNVAALRVALKEMPE